MRVVVGRIGRAHGIRGDVRVDVRTDEPEACFAVGAVLATDPTAAGPLTLAESRWHSGRLLVRFVGVDSRSAAEALGGVVLETDRDPSARPADPDEYYDHQLVGLSVVDVAGVGIGEVSEVLHLPAQDLLAVRRPDGREVLVPFVASIVPRVDLRSRQITVDPPTGLLDGPE